MKKIFTLLVMVLLANATIAQEKTPVQFLFSTQRTNDSLVQLKVSAKLEKGFQLFGVKKQNAEDAFVSALQLDETNSAQLLDTMVEQGKQVQIAATDDAKVIYKVFEDSVHFVYSIKLAAQDSLILKGQLNWLGKQADQFPSGSTPFSIEIIPTNTSAIAEESDVANQTLWQIFLLTFLTGLLAVITPCVFPLIPVTVSFFLKRSKTRVEGIRNALWYSLSIIGIYTVPTILLVLIFGDDILYQISTSAISNLLFFAIFLVLQSPFLVHLNCNFPIAGPIRQTKSR